MASHNQDHTLDFCGKSCRYILLLNSKTLY